MIFVSSDGEHAWMEDEVREAYACELLDRPHTEVTFEEWVRNLHDIGLRVFVIDEFLDEILGR